MGIVKAFRRSGFTEREAAALLGALAVLQGDDVVNAKAVKKEDKGQAKARGKMGRGGEKASTNYAIDLYGTNEVWFQEGGLRKEGGRRVVVGRELQPDLPGRHGRPEEGQEGLDARRVGAAAGPERPDLGAEVRRRAPDLPQGPGQVLLPHHAGRRAVHGRQV